MEGKKHKMSSELSKTTRNKKSASATDVSKPTSRLKVKKQTHSPKKTKELAKSVNLGDQILSDKKSLKNNASKKSSTKSKTSKKTTSHDFIDSKKLDEPLTSVSCPNPEAMEEKRNVLRTTRRKKATSVTDVSKPISKLKVTKQTYLPKKTKKSAKVLNLDDQQFSTSEKKTLKTNVSKKSLPKSKTSKRKIPQESVIKTENTIEKKKRKLPSKLSSDINEIRNSIEIEDETKIQSLSKKAKIEVPEPSFSVGGHLMTFGDDICGELGQKVIGLSKKRPVLVEGISDKVVYIAVGAMHNVCITSKNHVYTFGCNDEGALGRDTSSDSNLESKPLKVPISAKVIKVTAGDSHTAALTSLGGVYFWGNFKDSNGSIGLTLNSNGAEIHPIHIPAFNLTFVDIASGGDHLLLLSDTGKVYSLGVAEQGQLGRFKLEETKFTKEQKELFLTPLPVQFSEDIECDRVWAGNYSSFARSKNGKIFAWGLNNYSQLGFKNSENELIVPFPKHVLKFTDLGCTIEDICAGQHHTIARDSFGKIYSFGRNEYGRLGHGRTGHDEDEPRLIESLEKENITDIASGSVCSFAISEKGHLYSWGMGSSQLGIGEGDLYEPTRVISSVLRKSRVLKASAGAQHTAIIVESEKSDRNGN